MEIAHRHPRTRAAWIFVPGLLMILVGLSILLFPRFFAAIVAGCFILSGLMLIQVMRSLGKAVERARAQLELSGYHGTDRPPGNLLPHRVYTSWIN